MQDNRAVGIKHTFGIACRARGIAKERACIFVKPRPVIAVWFGRDHLLVTQPAIAGAFFIRKHDIMFHRFQLRFDPLDNFGHIAVGQQGLAAGMVDCENQMFVGQAGIGRMQHRAHARNRKKQLEMAMCVPA